MMISVVTWLTTGYRQFRGPQSGGVVIVGNGEVGVNAPIDVDEDEKKR